eukprot:6821594-Alexandrium_andersonii.AAC.1
MLAQSLRAFSTSLPAAWVVLCSLLLVRLLLHAVLPSPLLPSFTWRRLVLVMHVASEERGSWLGAGTWGVVLAGIVS